MVGCVVVQDDRLLAEGWHRKHGEGHAEVNALAQLAPSLDLSRATAYVTLEPCSHTGKTPPCADLLVSRGVGTRGGGHEGPQPSGRRRGVERLKHAGVTCEVGCLEDEARRLNAAFVHSMTIRVGLGHLEMGTIVRWIHGRKDFSGPWCRRVALTGAASQALDPRVACKARRHLGGHAHMARGHPFADHTRRAWPSPRPLILTQGQTTPWKREGGLRLDLTPRCWCILLPALLNKRWTRGARRGTRPWP